VDRRLDTLIAHEPWNQEARPARAERASSGRWWSSRTSGSPRRYFTDTSSMRKVVSSDESDVLRNWIRTV